MKQPEIILIAAVSRNNVIGVNGTIPWQEDRKNNELLVKEDFKHFKSLTAGYPIIMGRVTYESIPKRPLPGRHNVVLTSDKSFSEPGVLRSSALEDALDVLEERSTWKDEIKYSKIFIGGGQKVYEAAMQYATSLEITHVDQHVEGPQMRYFPKIDPALWKEDKDKRIDRQGYSFVTYVRK